MPASSVSELLLDLRNGRTGASDRLFAYMYDELCRLAHVVRSGRAPATLNTTALVHEAFMHLRPSGGLEVESKRHFFRLAARAMRQVIAREVRHRCAQKRGGDVEVIAFKEGVLKKGVLGRDVPVADLLSIEDALQTLERMHRRQARVVECRFYAGLTIPETAAVLDISTATVKRDWRAARAWLIAYLRGSDEDTD
jgi:RNA polymerase sigma factor (TIGR02999 family)